MSVLIRGMEMPKGCAFCKISRRNGKNRKMICPFIWKCEWDIHDPMSADHRLDDCPLVAVPPHGDLIDKSGFDVLSWNEKDEGDFTDGVLFVLDKLDKQPVIIPAERERDETLLW